MINTIVNFSSISSDNNLFDFETMLNRIKRKADISSEQYTRMVREYIHRKYPNLSGIEQGAVVALFLTADMTYKHFVESLDAMGMTMTVSVDLCLTNPPMPENTFFNTDINQLDLPIRVTNSLRYAGGINTYGDLVKLDEKKVMRIKNFGDAAWHVLEKAMREKKLHFGMTEAPTETKVY